MTFFRRSAAIDVELKSGEILRVRDLRIAFEVSKENKPSANKAEIKIYNLSQTTRNKLREKDALVRVFCGYEGEGGAGLVFVGNAQYIVNEWQTPEIVTTIEAQDGIRATRESRVSLSYGNNTKAKTVLDRVIGEMGLIPRQTYATNGFFPQGYSFNGRCKDSLDEICNRFGLTWTIVDNQIQILQKGSDTERVYLISPESGLINTPERCEDQEGDLEKGRTDSPEWKVTSLLNPSLNPGDRMELRSKDANGIFKIDTVKHMGDTRGQEWYTVCEVRSI